MTSGYYRTSSPVTALPMIMRWISDVPSKVVKLVDVRAVSAGGRPVDQLHGQHQLTTVARQLHLAPPTA
jgi:hypothetical protein